MLRKWGVAGVVSALAIVGLAGPAGAHGAGGTSSACWDGVAPDGTYHFESGKIGVRLVDVGVQFGANSGGHLAYTDLCTRTEIPRACITLPFLGANCIGGQTTGNYRSVRTHSNPDDCNGVVVQAIYRTDPDSNFGRNIPDSNTCPE